MLSIERLKRMEEMLREEESITLSNMSKRLGVSEPTVRRDTSQLEKQQILFRSQGRILLHERIGNNLIDLVSFREKSNLDIKRIVDKAAAEL